MRVLVISGGRPPSQALLEEMLAWCDRLICADRGYEAVQDQEIRPDLVVGDFDSLSQEGLEALKASGLRLEVLSPVKDETDTEMAIRRALEMGAGEIRVLGATGSRIDHLLGALYLGQDLVGTQVSLKFIDDKNQIQVLGPGTYDLEDLGYQYVSLLPISREALVTTGGMAYSVTRTPLVRGRSLGVSNELGQDGPGRLRVHSGLVFLIYSRD